MEMFFVQFYFPNLITDYLKIISVFIGFKYLMELEGLRKLTGIIMFVTNIGFKRTNESEGII